MKVGHELSRRFQAGRIAAAFGAVLLVAAVTASGVLARVAAAPQNTANPSISGSAKEGNTLSANHGNWSNAPTAYGYQWQQCNSAGSSCSDITGATSSNYKLAASDVDKTVRVAVTASNSDGQSTANSNASAIVSSAKGPVNTAPPTISGTPKVGEELSAANGTWTGGAQSYGYQWQQCDSTGANCAAINDATSRAFGVRTADVGHTLRVVVTAKNASDSTSATSAATGVVTASGAATTTTTTTTTRNHAPTISFVSLRRLGPRVYARFSTCDDSAKTLTIVERDTKAHVVTYTRRFSVAGRPCGTHARNWILPVRFRGHGRYTATLRAIDKSGASSRTVSRSLTFK
jgi:hypothetical protein